MESGGLLFLYLTSTAIVRRNPLPQKSLPFFGNNIFKELLPQYDAKAHLSMLVLLLENDVKTDEKQQRIKKGKRFKT